MPLQTFGAWLRAARESRSLTQLDLGDLTGIANVTISHFETDRRLPTLSQAAALSSELFIDMNEVATRIVKERLMKTLEGRILMAEFRDGRFYDHPFDRE